MGIRVRVKDGIARVLFTVEVHEAILLHGFIKKSQTIPADLHTALMRRKQLRDARRRWVETTEGAMIMSCKKHNPHVGSDFEDFLAEEGQLEGATAVEISRAAAALGRNVRVQFAA